ncbi:hypothetical protein [Qipengyuania nanhaisediminis]|uniref:hypothetical protein n=1 Tax=Qipengyuania nanhaisediminis TaxID=604088 RepID=UPI0038B35FD2
MNVGTIAMLIAGLFCFGVGAYLAATGNRTTGIALMAMGLIFQVLTLRQLKSARRTHGDEQ